MSPVHDVRTLRQNGTKLRRLGYPDIDATTDPPPTDPPPPTGALFAGHVPNRVLVGIAAADGSSGAIPVYDEACTILGQPIYETRQFTGGNYSLSSFNSMMSDADSQTALPVISFKYGNWASVAAGNFDADLQLIYNQAVARRTSGPGGTPEPFLCSFHHEPAGDEPVGQTLADWADMQTYCAWWFGGRRGGTAGSTYVAADDVSDIMAWAPVGNGFWWRSTGSPGPTADANVAWPDRLLDALRANHGVILNDFYDIDYIDMQKAMTDRAYRIPATSGVRTSKRISNFMQWYRAKVPNNDIAVGCGEFGCITGAEITACWTVMRNNRDVWAISNYFNSMNASDHDWRLVPSNFRISSPVYTSGKGLKDLGGDTQSQGRLDAFRTMLTESTSAQYTSPL